MVLSTSGDSRSEGYVDIFARITTLVPSCGRARNRCFRGLHVRHRRPISRVRSYCNSMNNVLIEAMEHFIDNRIKFYTCSFQKNLNSKHFCQRYAHVIIILTVFYFFTFSRIACFHRIEILKFDTMEASFLKKYKFNSNNEHYHKKTINTAIHFSW